MNDRAELVAKAERFQALHHGPEMLVLPNAWDAMSGLLLERAGFAAVATTSAGVGYALGRRDRETAPRAEALDTVARVARRLAVPVSADMEAGYGRTPAEVGETVRLTLAAGAVGINLEDSDYTRASESEPRLFPIAAAAERIAAARAAADRAGVPLVVNARTDVMWNGGAGPAAFEDAVARANAYRAAGADCLFVPGVRDVDVIRRLVRAIDGPLNVMIGAGSASAG